MEKGESPIRSVGRHLWRSDIPIKAVQFLRDASFPSTSTNANHIIVARRRCLSMSSGAVKHNGVTAIGLSKLLNNRIYYWAVGRLHGFSQLNSGQFFRLRFDGV